MIIQSKRVYINEEYKEAQLEIADGKIVNILPYGACAVDRDFGNNRILPGFIDVHTHGSYGYDTNDGEPEGLRDWMKRIPEEGVTSILPTTVTQMPEVLIKALKNVASVVSEGYEGAEILGVHLEGPFLDMDYKGAQPPEAILEPSVDVFKSFFEASNGLIKYITLAPEHDKNLKLTKFCVDNGVTVSMGHSKADYKVALEAIDAGATSMTHVFNGMPSLHHRNVGLVGVALLKQDLYGEIIGDGMHVSKEAIKLFFNQKGKDHGILITDSLRAKHCPKGGTYDLGGHEIVIDDFGLARLKGTDTIAGSTLNMNKGLKLLIEEALVPERDAINAATINPAKAIRVDDRKGLIKAGYDADMAVLNDDYDVLSTFVRGHEFTYQN